MRSFIPRSCGVNIIAQGLDKGDKWSAGMEPRGDARQAFPHLCPYDGIWLDILGLEPSA